MRECDLRNVVEENARLKETKLERDEFIALGYFNPSKTKILHLKENPIHAANTDEPSTPQTPTAIPAVKSPKEEVEALRKRIERMKEVFALQTNRFRDAV